MAKIKKSYNYEYSIRFLSLSNRSWRKWVIKYYFPRFGRLRKGKGNLYIFNTDAIMLGDYKYMDVKRI